MIEKYNLRFFKKRILIFVIVLSIIFLAVIGRLFYIQVYNGAYLQLKASEQWTRDLPLSAERGVISDRNGSSLAVSYTTYTIYTRAREIKDKNSVASFLSSKLDLDYISVLEKVGNSTVSEVLIKMQVDKNIAMEILKDYDGVYLSESISRYYPYGNLLTQVLGFTTIDNIGQAGIEAFCNQLLCGVRLFSDTKRFNRLRVI